MLAHVTYDGTTLSMNLLDLVTNKSFVLTKAINIPQIVGANTAYVGFTGSTGGLTATQKILSWTYSTQAPGPVTRCSCVFAAGWQLQRAAKRDLERGTAGAVIYYTTNGTAPTTSSSAYSGPIAVGAGTTTIEAMAVASGSSQSAVVTATYVVGLAGDGDSDLQSGRRHIHDLAERDVERWHCGRGDLLHDQWNYANYLLTVYTGAITVSGVGDD